jgi:hypothetical protein
MSAVVIDTNVLATANGQASHAGPACVLASVRALEKIRKGQTVFLDTLGRILGEYYRHASRSGQPGPGDAFAKWLWQNQGYSKKCQAISITPRGSGMEDYQEFPSDPALATFDTDDRKFVAVALASARNPPILNAVDTDWCVHHAALKQNGVRVRFLCPDLMKSKS